jgi:hypothetical protein
MNKFNTFPKGYGLGYAQCVGNDEKFESPMLVVGSNTYIRSIVSGTAWDIFLLLFPTSDSLFRVGAVYMSRDEKCAAFRVSEGISIEDTVKKALQGPNEAIELHPKAFAWLNNSIYRCPKVSINNLLTLTSGEKK